MPHTGPDPEGDPHARFFLLAGLIRHEFWLHHLRADNYAFTADADLLTLSARHHERPEESCSLQLTEEMLREDLSMLASEFFKMHCAGTGPLARRRVG
jgi:hypothetical protein